MLGLIETHLPLAICSQITNWIKLRVKWIWTSESPASEQNMVFIIGLNWNSPATRLAETATLSGRLGEAAYWHMMLTYHFPWPLTCQAAVPLERERGWGGVLIGIFSAESHRSSSGRGKCCHDPCPKCSIFNNLLGKRPITSSNVTAQVLEGRIYTQIWRTPIPNSSNLESTLEDDGNLRWGVHAKIQDGVSRLVLLGKFTGWGVEVGRIVGGGMWICW